MRASETPLTRREFMALTTAASARLAMASPYSGHGNAADLVLHNGHILTVDAAGSIAEAVAVKDGLILKVGSNPEVAQTVGRGTRLFDLQGRTVTPGLVDSHIHVLYQGKQDWEGFVDIRLPNVSSKEDLIRVVGEKVASLPAGEWVSGNQGIPLAFGCDVPATPYIEPNWAFAGAVTRTTWLENTYNEAECISMQDTLRIHTMGSAYASFEEAYKGSIESGKVGDMVVWSQDLLSLDPMEDLVDLKAEATLVAGKVVFNEESESA